MGEMDAVEWPGWRVTCGGAGPCRVSAPAVSEHGATEGSQKREKRKPRRKGRATGTKGHQTGETWVDGEGSGVGRVWGLVSPEPGHPKGCG